MEKSLFYDHRTNLFFKGDLKEVLETIEEAIQNHKSHRYLAEKFVFGSKFNFEMLESIDVTQNTKVIAGLIDLGNGEKEVCHMIIG